MTQDGDNVILGHMTQDGDNVILRHSILCHPQEDERKTRPLFINEAIEGFMESCGIG